MFPLQWIADILRAASEDIGLINRVIKFHIAQRMWSGFSNVTDGQTDGRHTTAIPLHCYVAWSGKNRRFWQTHYRLRSLATELPRISAHILYFSNMESMGYIFLLLIVWVYLLSNFRDDLRKTHYLCSKVRYGRSGSSKVVDFGGNRQDLWDFLLVISSNLDPILHRYWDTATYRLKKLSFFPTPLI